MTDTALQAPPIEPAARSSGPNLDKGFNPLTLIIFMGVMAAGLLYVAYSVYSDVEATGTKITSYLPYVMLLVALLIALGFEFVNGFHDTANAVATVIYTHSLPAELAVVWSGAFNCLGVLTSTGAVAFGIVSLLPVELILQAVRQRPTHYRHSRQAIPASHTARLAAKARPRDRRTHSPEPPALARHRHESAAARKRRRLWRGRFPHSFGEHVTRPDVGRGAKSCRPVRRRSASAPVSPVSPVRRHSRRPVCRLRPAARCCRRSGRSTPASPPRGAYRSAKARRPVARCQLA
jgi:Phosphate transporter family